MFWCLRACLCTAAQHWLDEISVCFCNATPRAIWPVCRGACAKALVAEQLTDVYLEVENELSLAVRSSLLFIL